MKPKLTECLGKAPLCFDGAMGTLLQNEGLAAGECPELWNLEHPQSILHIHHRYAQAGAILHKSNTFGANTFKFPKDAPLEKTVQAGVQLLLQAVQDTGYVALDLGPTGQLFQPYGVLTPDSAADAFRPALRAGAQAGADFILFETFSNLYEAKAALLAAAEETALPVFISFTFAENGRLLDGATPACCALLAESLGAAAVGINCGFGPEQMLPLLQQMRAQTTLPIFCNANAGLPIQKDGALQYAITPKQFANACIGLVDAGAAALGGCCGTDPDYICALSEVLQNRTVSTTTTCEKLPLRICSKKKLVSFDAQTVIIGERLNPTGKPKMRQALTDADDAYLCTEAIRQAQDGAAVLDVNVGVPGIDEAATMAHVISLLQQVTDLPLQIDTSDPAAAAQAMRLYNGVPLLNSINGKEESLSVMLPLLQKYGGVAVALLLDEKGIPQTAKERLNIAERILERAKAYGIGKERLLFDALTLSVSTGAANAEITLEVVRTLAARGCYTVLGVSNISFGMPNRPLLNAAFLLRAMENGLSAAIVNPACVPLMEAYHAACALYGNTNGIREYIAFVQTQAFPPSTPAKQSTSYTVPSDPLQDAIERGISEIALPLAKKALKTTEPVDLIRSTLIPALERVGHNFETGKIFLPELMQSAECAAAISALCRAHMPAQQTAQRPEILLATVQGDVHDIGKNIVRTVLESYGYAVLDLGKDVAPQAILHAVLEQHISLVGLSALMTTTVPAMEETVKLLHAQAPFCRVMVGGAVLTKDYADQIGADYYCHDAMDDVKVAKEVLKTHEKQPHIC